MLEAPAQTIPRHVPPMLARLSGMPPAQERYGFEYKWDGIRILSYWDGRSLQLESRNLLDVTGQYPEVQQLIPQLTARSLILDGEIVAFNDKGRVSFLRLAHRMHVSSPQRVAERMATYPVTYMIFDVLYLNGESLMGQTYERRREVLAGLGLEGPHWHTPPWVAGEGDAMADAAHNLRLEGIVAKRLDSVYEVGKRTGAWLKIKFVGRQEFVIAGWTPLRGEDESMVGSLLVGYYDPPDGPAPRLLHYAGAVGSGYGDADRRELAGLLREREISTSPFAEPVSKPGAHFARPELVGEVEYRGWGPTGSLRQPAFKGLRHDKPPEDVVREDRWVKRR